MIAIASLLLVIALSLLIVRVGAIALTMTGLSDEVARFQALSAFSGAGFTTGESENVVAGPARRRIVAWLIRAGSAGVVTAISTLMLSMLGERFATGSKLIVLVLGVTAIIAVARSSRLDALTRPLIERALRRSATLELRDYAGLLHLREDWRVAEVDVEPGSWLAGRTLSELRLRSEGVTVLGVEHPDGTYQGAPDGGTVLEPGDRLVLYGHAERLHELSARREGDTVAHEAARRDARARRDEARRGRDAPGATRSDADASPSEVAAASSGGRGA